MNPLLSQIHARFLHLDELYRARDFRERMLLGGGIVAIAFFVIDTHLVQPTTAQLEISQRAKTFATADILRLEAERSALQNVELTEEELKLLAKKQHLQQQLSEVNAQIKSQISELVPPTAIVSVLEEMLSPDSGLKLIELSSLEPHRLGSGETTESNAGGQDLTAALYRHGLRIEIEGEFDAMLDYLRRVEQSSWNLLWDRFEYKVKQYPEATVTIDIQTISEEEEWIGV